MGRAERRRRERTLGCRDAQEDFERRDSIRRDSMEYSLFLEGEVERASRTIADKDATLAQTRRQLDDERAQVGTTSLLRYVCAANDGQNVLLSTCGTWQP